nr:MAG TPA: hypothetical protein [Caudoviricetes sp.]
MPSHTTATVPAHGHQIPGQIPETSNPAVYPVQLLPSLS